MVSAVSDSLSNMLDLLVHWFEPTLGNSFESHTYTRIQSYIWCIHASTSTVIRIEYQISCLDIHLILDVPISSIQ